LLWFDPKDPERGGRDFEKIARAAAALFERGRFDYATDLFHFCLMHNPADVSCLKQFLAALRKQFGSPKALGPMTQFKARAERKLMKEAAATGDWASVLQNGLDSLHVDPWNEQVLDQMATACENLARRGAPDWARYAECARFYRECVEALSKS
jgi:hypothetical protein